MIPVVSLLLALQMVGSPYAPLDPMDSPYGRLEAIVPRDEAGPVPTVLLFTTDPRTSEPGGQAHFTVARNGITNVALTVAYTFVGQATPGLDFRQLSGSVVIPVGRFSADVTVQVLDDLDLEGSETIRVELAESPHYAIGATNGAVLTISDNEPIPTVSVEALAENAFPVVDETWARIRFVKTNALEFATRVRFSLSGTASSGVDFEPVSDSVLLPPGVASVELPFKAIRNRTSPSRKALTITIDAEPVYRISSSGNDATVFIHNNPYFVVESPDANQVFQRDSNGRSSIRIRGHTRVPGGVLEARYGSRDWAVIDGSGEGRFDGILSQCPGGQEEVQLRFRDVEDSTYSIPFVGVGEVFAIWGQSNGSGRGRRNQTYSHPRFKAGLFGNDWKWQELKDPIDSSIRQVDTVSSDADSEMGSIWPLVATDLMDAIGVPVAFVPCTKGGSGFSGNPSWNPGTNVLDRRTLFGSAVERTKAAGPIRGILWWQGEEDFDDPTGNSYLEPYLRMSSEAARQIPGVRLIPCKLQECVGFPWHRQTNRWHAVARIWDEDTHSLPGPALADSDPLPNGNLLTEFEGRNPPYFHLKSDEALREAAKRWTECLVSIIDNPPLHLTWVPATDGPRLIWRHSATATLFRAEEPDGAWSPVSFGIEADGTRRQYKALLGGRTGFFVVRENSR